MQEHIDNVLKQHESGEALGEWTYTLNGAKYTLLLWRATTQPASGRQRLAYRWVRELGGENSTILFHGDQFETSPYMVCTSYKCREALLCFLAAQADDLDEDYFAEYSASQLEWRDSEDCTELRTRIIDDTLIEVENQEEEENSCDD